MKDDKIAEDISNLTFYRADWYSACYNYYNGQFYDYYETKYNTAVNKTMKEIMDAIKSKPVVTLTAENTSSNGTSDVNTTISNATDAISAIN